MSHLSTQLIRRRSGRLRPHILRRDGVLQAPSEISTSGRYAAAVAVGWRPLG